MKTIFKERKNMSTVKNGSAVKVHYRGTLNDGTEFDSSYERGETLNFQVGTGQMIPGFDSGVVGMSAGETKTITIEPEMGYGNINPEAVTEVAKTQFPGDFEFEIGATVHGQGPQGPIMAKILAENADTIQLDFNHPLAGETLTFEVEMVEVS